MRGLAIAIGAAVALALAAPAAAKEPSKRDRRRAAQLVRDARRAKKMGDRYAASRNRRLKKRAMRRYRAAVLAYKKAYALVPEPPIVFELAEVYEARGDVRWAWRGYARYLELAPDGDRAPEAAERVERLAAQLDGAGEPDDPDLDPTDVFGPEPEPEPPAAPDPEPEVATAPAPVAAARPQTAPADRPAPRRGRWLRYGGIGTAIAGGLLLGLGVKYGRDAAAASDALSAKEGPWTEEDRRRIDRGESAETKAIALSVAGAAAIVAGGALYYLGLRTGARGDAGVSAVPTALPGGAGLAVEGRF